MLSGETSIGNTFCERGCGGDGGGDSGGGGDGGGLCVFNRSTRFILCFLFVSTLTIDIL